MSDEYVTPAVSQEHQDTYDWLCDDRSPAYHALMSVLYDGEPTSCIVHVHFDGDDVVMTPLAVMLTKAMMAKLRDPHGDAPGPVTP